MIETKKPDEEKFSNILVYTATRNGEECSVAVMLHEDNRISYVIEDENGKPFTNGVLLLPDDSYSKKAWADALYAYLTKDE